MSITQPTNSVILVKLEGLQALMEEKFKYNEQDHKQVNEHLKTLNGQVAKNTKYRESGPYVRVLLMLGAGTAGGLGGIELKTLILALIGI